VLRHKDWNQQLREDLKVAEYLRGKAVWEKTQLQTEALWSSVKLCQVGTEHMHRVLKKNSIVSSDRKNQNH
jgi:hypothetical protein